MLFGEERFLFRFRYQGKVPFDIELLKGAKRLRILTYSASEDLVRELALEGEEVEVIMGHPYPAANLSTLGAIQEAHIRELQEVLKVPERFQALLDRMRQGSFRILLSRRQSHAKLFLVETERERYVLFGSANLSGQALVRPLDRGGQLELLSLVEDEEGFRELEAIYEAVRKESDPLPAEILRKERVTLEDLPLVERAAREPVVIEVQKEVPVVYRVDFPTSRVARPLRALWFAPLTLYTMTPSCM